jgi:hypothetical protein
MTIVTKQEWESLGEVWRSRTEAAEPLIEALRKRVRRDTRRWMAAAVAEGAVTLGLLGFSALLAFRTPSTHNLIWAAAIWIFTIIAAGFSLYGYLRVFDPMARSTEAFLDISRRRCLTKIRAARFAYGLLAAELVFIAVWGAWEWSLDPGHFKGNPAALYLRYGLVAALACALGAWAHFMHSRAARDLEELEEIRKQAGVEPPMAH